MVTSTVYEVFDRWALTEPDRAAIYYEGRTYSFEDIRRESVHAAGGLKTLGVMPSDRIALWLWVVDRRVPRLLAEGYVPMSFRRILERVPGTNAPIYSLLESEYGETVTEVQQDFHALDITPRQARLLEVQVGSAGLHVTRRYFGQNDNLLLVTISLYAGDRFSYAMRHRYNSQAERMS